MPYPKQIGRIFPALKEKKEEVRGRGLALGFLGKVTEPDHNHCQYGSRDYQNH
jgi:hypothetical protein